LYVYVAVARDKGWAAFHPVGAGWGGDRDPAWVQGLVRAAKKAAGAAAVGGGNARFFPGLSAGSGEQPSWESARQHEVPPAHSHEAAVPSPLTDVEPGSCR
jgi:hypothetical protein